MEEANRLGKRRELRRWRHRPACPWNHQASSQYRTLHRSLFGMEHYMQSCVTSGHRSAHANADSSAYLAAWIFRATSGLCSRSLVCCRTVLTTSLTCEQMT
eukprot:2079286-Rhodomonas_salina.1